MVDLRRKLLGEYRPSSKTDEAPRLYTALYQRASVKVPFNADWQGARDTLKPLSEANNEKLGIALGNIGATRDQRGRRILIVPLTLGHVVLRETADANESFKNWASPRAQALEGMGRNNVSVDFILRCIQLSKWPATAQS